MGQVLQASGKNAAGAINISLTRYGPLAGNNASNVDAATESVVHCTARDSYTLSLLYARVVANTITATTTVRTRVNSANGNQSLSIGSSATGEFVDNTNSDSVVTGDDLNLQTVTGGTGTSIDIRQTAVQLEHSGTTSMQIMGGNAGSSFVADGHFPIHGTRSYITAEADAQTTMRTAVTFSQQRVRITANSATVANFNFRKNGANGNQTVAVGSGATGEFVDSSNSDSVAVGDEVCVLMDLTSGASIAVALIEWEITGGAVRAGVASAAGTGFTAASTFQAFNGVMGSGISTESQMQVDVNNTTPMKNMFVRVPTNTSSGASSVDLRVNSANQISVSIGAAGTGFFEETATTYNPTSTDAVDFQIQQGGTGTLTITLISVEMLPTAAPAAARPVQKVIQQAVQRAAVR